MARGCFLHRKNDFQARGSVKYILQTLTVRFLKEQNKTKNKKNMLILRWRKTN